MAIDVQKEVMSAVVSLIRMKMFYGHILQQMQKIIIDKGNEKLFGIVPTIAVGRMPGEKLLKLYVNKEFVEKLYEEHKQSAFKFLTNILEHECLHVIFNHLSMRFTDKNRGSVAVDLAVNSYIAEDGLPPNCCLPKKYNLPEKKTAFWYYQELAKKKIETPDNHAMWSNCVGDESFDDYIKDIVRKSKDLCGAKGYGDLPGEVQQMLDALLRRKPAKIPWNRVLRQFCAQHKGDSLDYTMKRISKRFGERPGIKMGDVLNLAVGWDLSGSISDAQAKMFINETDWIYKNGANITVYEFDTIVHAKYPWTGKFSGKINGRGGTDYNEVLDKMDEDQKYDAIVICTDFEAPPVKRKPRIPVLWVLSGRISEKDWPVKWGKKAYMDNGEAEGF